MKVKVSFESNINVQKHMDQVRDPAFWKYGASEWHRLYFPYVPMNTGALAETVKHRGHKGYGETEHIVPYAHDAYESNRNFRKDKHKLASSHWNKAAEPTQKPKLIDAMQDYVNSGRLKLNG